MIDSVLVKQFKCLRDVRVELGAFTVLIGPNDSGKSSFLEALRLPGRAAVGVADSAFEVTVRAQGRNLAAASDGSGAITSTLTPDLPGGAMALTRQLPDVFDISEPVRLDARAIAKGGARGEGALAKLIESRGAGVSAHLVRIATGNRALDKRVQEAMQAVTKGRIQEVIAQELDPSTSRYPLLFRLFDGETVVPASGVSEGLLLYLAFLSLVHREDPLLTLLVEEPEAGLHPSRLREVVGLLRGLAAKGTQVILTTHSPDLLNACRPEEVRVFLRPDADSWTKVYELPPDFDKIRMRDTLGQVWASRGEEGLLDFLRPAAPSVVATG